MRLAAVESGTLFGLVLLYIWWLHYVFPQFWALLLFYVLLSFVLGRQTPMSVGFRTSGFRQSCRRFGPLVAGIAVFLVLGAWIADTFRNISLRWAVLDLLAYCVWGLLQQFVLQAFFVNRIVQFSRRPCLVAALMFSAVHAPNWFLMLVTLAGGYAASLVYLRYRNLYFLGLAHGVLGSIIYFTVPDSISRHLYVGPRWFGT